MPYFIFNWSEELIEKLAEKHALVIDDFEAVVSDPDETSVSRSSGRPMAFGYTADGRYIACVYELEQDGVTVTPVTAYPVPEPRC